jgi:hypothetical protein
VHPRRGEPIVDRHDRVFSRKGHHVTVVGDLVDFHASSEGPRGHKILHHVAVTELVLDGVSVVRAGLLRELLEVVRGQSCLALSTVSNGRSACHAGVARLIVDVTIVARHSVSLPTVLLTPLLVALGALPDILNDDIERRFPTAAWGQMELGCLTADDALGSDAAQLCSGVHDCVSWCLQRS